MDFDGYAYTVAVGREFEGETVELDGNWFSGCRFTDCTMIFRGEAPFAYAGTTADRCRFLIEGRARMILSVLGRMVPADDLLSLIGQLAAEMPTRN